MGKVRRIAREEGIRPRLLRALIRQESGNNRGAVSPAGAIGRTQLMPGTARSLGVNPYNDSQNVRGGARYLRQQLDRFGNEREALAAYNAGPGAVEKYGGVPPYAETRNYVRSILGNAGHGSNPSRSSTGSAGRVDPGVASHVDLSRRTVFDKAGFEQARRRAFLGDFLRRSGHGNSILFRSGLLSTQEPSREGFTDTRLRSNLVRGTDPRIVDAGGGGSVGDGGLPSGAASAAVRAARKRLGIREVGTSNQSPRLNRWEQRFGMVGQPWCGIFAGVVLQRAGVRGVDSSIASVAAIEANARAGRGPFRGFANARHARAGDLLITIKGQHVAFVEGVDRDGTIHVIGGNQSGAVTRATHRPDQVYGVARVRYNRR